MRLRVEEKITDFKTKTWERVTRPRWGSSRLSWIKSGEQSLVHGTPYEIYEKWYGPTKLTVENVPTITTSIKRAIQKRLPYFPEENSKIAIHFTVVKGKDRDGNEITTSQQAKRAYGPRVREKQTDKEMKETRRTGEVGASLGKTSHTDRVEVENLSYVVNQMRTDLLYLLNKQGSNNVWLVVVAVHLYPPKEHRVRVR